ncbi:MAG: hypothetical protein H7Z15_04305 [Rhizobacter sp.]|nr:hypothetical protein [Rhizobacter sp.]
MNRDNPAPSPAARVIDALLRALAPGEELSTEAEVQQHFPFARLGADTSPQAHLRRPTTVPGSL